MLNKLYLTFFTLLFLSTPICRAMEEPEAPLNAKESRMCLVCHDNLESDILDMPCHNIDFAHKSCFLDYVKKSLEDGFVPNCLLCQDPVELKSLELNVKELDWRAQRTFCAAVHKKYTLAALKKVIEYEDLTEEGRDLAIEIYNAIQKMPLKELFNQFAGQIINYEAVKKLLNQPDLYDSLLRFEEFKERGMEVAMNQRLLHELRQVVENREKLQKYSRIGFTVGFFYFAYAAFATCFMKEFNNSAHLAFMVPIIICAIYPLINQR